MSVGKRIKALRARNGISNQEELAYLVGAARQTVSSWERDVFLPDGANLLKLSQVLNTSVAYIMGETVDSGAPQRDARRSDDGTAYSIRAHSAGTVIISIEKSEKGKTVRYDLPPEYAASFLPMVEQLWKKIELKMEEVR